MFQLIKDIMIFLGEGGDASLLIANYAMAYWHQEKFLREEILGPK